MGAGISWQLVGVVVSIIGLFSAVSLVAVRYMLLGHRKHTEQSIDNLSVIITTGNNEVKRIERELIDLKISMPNDYVKREDWIRFASVIDAKQDGLGDRLTLTNDRVAVTNEKIERLLERTKQ
ncbi:MAG TPA: hypothetical protein ENJ64_03855 [Thiotrichales bacterium]|nr:hypothetical protein [Thiotrichales bacterium]